MELDHLTLLRPDGQTIEKRGRGIGPLLNIYLFNVEAMKGASLYDKVIGKAAAAFCVLGGIKEVRAHLLSVGAKQLLEENGIQVRYEVLTEKIMNRAQTDLCPMEKACLNEEEPVAIAEAVKKQAQAMGLI